MIYENIKSIILTVLVLISLVLTWSLWTYQPMPDYVRNEKLIEDVGIRESLDISNVIKPDKVLYHQDTIHYGTVELQEITRLMKEIRNWSLYDIESITSYVSEAEFYQFMHGSGKMEILFPDTIPMETLRYLLSMQEAAYPNAYVDRIVLDVKQDNEEPIVHLVNYNERRIYRAKVNNLFVENVDRSFFKPAVRNPAYRAIPVTGSNYIFAPAGRIELRRLHYLVNYLSPEDFRDNLFPDPSLVTRDPLTGGEEYTDGSRIMRVDQNWSRLEFANPIGGDGTNTPDFNVVEQSIHFINEHSGWTDRYVFANWERSYPDHTATFRLYVNDHPVFHSQGLSEMKQIWRNNSIYQYTRPLSELRWSIRNEEETIILPSAEAALSALEKMSNFERENLQNLRVGYELRRDLSNNGVFILEPVWMYEYNNSWKSIVFQRNEELGGM
ncbi:MAG: two-component system activity regulator YycH [Bacillaceae bacterium]|nr:two-component system activity regulator YycH [Bacillaceae bacterium]